MAKGRKPKFDDVQVRYIFMNPDGLSRAELAKRLEVSEMTIYNVLSGKGSYSQYLGQFLFPIVGLSL